MYTMKLDTTIPELEKLIGKKVTPLPRGGLEENSEDILKEARNQHVAILIGGDALSATTHISLLLDARDDGIETNVIHGSSIFTAITDTGLSLYKFGKTVTVPLKEKGPVDTVLKTIDENYENGLHTLMLLDLDISKDKYLTIGEAIKRLLETGQFHKNTLLVGVARLGSKSPTIKADNAIKLIEYDFGKPLHTLIAPGKLHFMEEEALEAFAGCPRSVILSHSPMGPVDKLISKYTASCRTVLEELVQHSGNLEVTTDQVKDMIRHAENYLDDAEYYWGEKKAVALTSVAYSEGILDALKLLGLVEFEW
jgi:diphthine synthase